MLLTQVLEIYELLDKADAHGQEVMDYLKQNGAEGVMVKKISDDEGSTDFIKIVIKGSQGKASGGKAQTLGIVGRLGGLGARPEITGFVSDGDGALAALAAALKLVKMQNHGDQLKGDVIITTHICPHAPTQDRKPVRFMDSPVDMALLVELEADPQMDAILSIDTSKGNYVINDRGFAISPTIKEGYILPVSDDLLKIMMRTTGKPPRVIALCQQDITPYENGLLHINSIVQPCTATGAAVVGVALTAEVPVAGCATGASHLSDIEYAARFAIEVAKDFTEGKCKFYDEKEFNLLNRLYGDMKRFQISGKPK